MYARSSTIHARPAAIDAGIAYLRDTAMPALTQIEGCIGMSLLVDRVSGRCIATSAWESEEAMQASRQAADELRTTAAQLFGATATVEEWEIAALHRDHRSGEGACVRATWAKVEPDQVDRALDGFKMATMPALEELDGFCSASLLLDRDAGLGVASVTFDSFESMRRSRQMSDTLKAQSIRDSGAEILDECEFELALAHLHVPEMA